MRRRFRRHVFAFLAAAAVLSPNLAAEGTPERDKAPATATAYAGSQRCAACHQTYYKGWVKTFHSTVVRDARKDPAAILADMNAPDLPFGKDDIHFTIGGHWDQRYLTRIGDDYYVLPKIWSIQSRKWRPYSAYGWQRRPYSRYCVGCHSVGFDPATRRIAEHAVGCESCHGAGVEHSDRPSKANILNPKSLPPERSQEICASCHVRGTDISGEYQFPIGWKPGEPLAGHMIPLEKNDGESGHDAIHRIWSKWKTDRESKTRARCEVCGIHQSARPPGEQANVNALCLRCHEYQDRIQQHTRHSADTRIGCGDCHEQKPPQIEERKDDDVHSYWYFLVHPRNCWDQDIHKKCSKCHAGKTERWAYDIFNSWKKPVFVDH